MVKLVRGVGINDADYPVTAESVIIAVDGTRKREVTWRCPYYTRWANMLQRVYSEQYHVKRGGYKDCTVCEEWKRFSTFKAWMEKQDWENMCLDKDMLFPGNKVYSPVTCVFVSTEVNLFITDNAERRGSYKIGCHFDKTTEKFRAKVRNPFTRRQEHIGYFATEDEAHFAWVTRKKELAELLAREQTDYRVAKALVHRYE